MFTQPSASIMEISTITFIIHIIKITILFKTCTLFCDDVQ